MKTYHYQEHLNINVVVFAKSKAEAREKAEAAIGQALSSMTPIDQIDQDVRDNSWDTIEVTIEEETNQTK